MWLPQVELQVYDWRRQGRPGELWPDILRDLEVDGFDLDIGHSLPAGAVPITTVPVDDETVQRVDDLLPPVKVKRAKLRAQLGVLISAGRAYREAGGNPDSPLLKERVALARRAEYHGVNYVSVESLLYTILRAKVWSTVAGYLDVDVKLIDALGVREHTGGGQDAPTVGPETLKAVREVLTAVKLKTRRDWLSMILSRLLELSQRRLGGEPDLSMVMLTRQRGGNGGGVSRHARRWRAVGVFDTIRDLVGIKHRLDDVGKLPPFPLTAADDYRHTRDQFDEVTRILSSNGYRQPDNLSAVLNGLRALHVARTKPGVWLTGSLAFDYHGIHGFHAEYLVSTWRNGSDRRPPVWPQIRDALGIADLDVGRGRDPAVFDFALPDESHRASANEIRAVADLLTDEDWVGEATLLYPVLNTVKALAKARADNVALGVREAAYHYGISSGDFVAQLLAWSTSDGLGQTPVWGRIAGLLRIDPVLGVGFSGDSPGVDWTQPDNRVSERQWAELRDLFESGLPELPADEGLRWMLDVVAAAGNLGYWKGEPPTPEEIQQIADAAQVPMDDLDTLGWFRLVPDGDVTLWIGCWRSLTSPTTCPSPSRKRPAKRRWTSTPPPSTTQMSTLWISRSWISTSWIR